jgi:hypothetical protein
MIRWFLILSLLQLVAFWRISGAWVTRPGWRSWASVPVVNLVLLYYVALTPWPRETASLKPPGAPGGPGDANFLITLRTPRTANEL